MEPLLTETANITFRGGIFPSSFKHPVVLPRREKPTLDISVLANYCPVSNLLFLSKLTEKLEIGQLKAHLIKVSLLDLAQSRFRTGHGTETALVALSDDLLLSVDIGQTSIPILLDPSGAFSTVDHDIPQSDLSNVEGDPG